MAAMWSNVGLIWSFIAFLRMLTFLVLGISTVKMSLGSSPNTQQLSSSHGGSFVWITLTGGCTTMWRCSSSNSPEKTPNNFFTASNGAVFSNPIPSIFVSKCSSTGKETFHRSRLLALTLLNKSFFSFIASLRMPTLSVTGILTEKMYSEPSPRTRQLSVMEVDMMFVGHEHCVQSTIENPMV
ncbi:hypothetical protein EDB83DRAFT_212419 [Lactarius deliciosus]|nr:hypothetical protein EDB83DRAFT_212419 [Lactarius deliciosus]